MNTIPIPGVPEDSRFAFEPDSTPGPKTRPVAKLTPGDTFLHRPSPKAEPRPVEVVRIEHLHVTGRVRVWAHHLRSSRSIVTPFIAGTFAADATVEVPDGARP